MNSTQLIGRLTTKPELKYTKDNVAGSNFTLAVARTYNREETDFINCVAWRNVAEILNKYCDKGSRIAVVGRIQTRTYDAQDGTKRYVTEVVVENVEFLDTKKERVENEVEQEVEPKSDPFAEFASEVALTDDDLPF